ncbi:MAG: hypothetical protein K2O10_04875 [Muribaculaceae bacterium]|nr:hypothetical protein [Muribaculaceae bacterium]
MVIAALFPPGVAARGKCSNIRSIEQLAARLDTVGDFQPKVKYAVSLPQADDDIVYTISLHSQPAAGDRLSPVDYLIKWSLPTPETVSEGFLSYFKGNHYRYRDNRLQEYHFDWDSIPFLSGTGGVQRNGQFVELLPQMLAADLRKMAADTTFVLRFVPDTVVSGQKAAVVKGVQRVRGYDSRYFTLVADKATGLPLQIFNEYNPGAISEQAVSVTYDYPSGQSEPLPVTEQALIAMYPEVFEKFRQSNYRIENMPGLPVPQFSLPTSTGERYTHARGEAFRAPVVIAVLDPAVGSTRQTVAALRKASASVPMENLLVFAMLSSHIDTVEDVVGPLRDNETLLLSASSLARDCGINECPVMIVAGRDGKITETIIGFNPNLAESVIQALARAK